MPTDEDFMRVALELAARGKGNVEPNPMVGAVVVRDDEIVAEGYHEVFGGPHAEVNAIAAGGGLCRGATMYVTLEPCAHHGKTPPCTEAVIRAGVAKVVAATVDPDPRTRGRGIETLRSNGLHVSVGVLAEDARELNAPFFKLIQTGMPYVTAKWAMTLDGKIASHTGDSKWITSCQSRRRAHQVRHEADGVLIGVGTALADDPSLTCRIAGGRNPIRIVVDSKARLPRSSKLVQTAREADLLIATTPLAAAERVRALEEAGCEVLVVDAEDGRVDLRQLLARLGERKMTNVLVEGGAELLTSLFEARLVDAVAVFVAPTVLGGREAMTPVVGRGFERIADAWGFADVTVEQIGNDILIAGTAVDRAYLEV